MAVHPFAQKAEALLDELKKLRANMKRAKKSADETQEIIAGKRPHRVGRGVFNLAVIGIGGGAMVDPGEANALYVTTPSPAMARLQQELANETLKCQEMRATEPIPGHWMDTPDGGQRWVGPSPGPQKNTPCPGVTAVQKKIRQLLERGNAYIVRRRR